MAERTCTESEMVVTKGGRFKHYCLQSKFEVDWFVKVKTIVVNLLNVPTEVRNRSCVDSKTLFIMALLVFLELLLKRFAISNYDNCCMRFFFVTLL